MRKMYLYLTLALGLLLTACGEDKKISMDTSTPVISLSAENSDRKPEEYQKFIEEYGEKLAPYQNIYYKDSFNATLENDSVTVYFDALTKVESPTVDSVYDLARFANNPDTKEQIVRAYLGDGEIYADAGDGWDKLSLQTAIANEEKELESINMSIAFLKENNADAYEISLQEDAKKISEINLENLKALLAEASETPSTNTFTGLSFSAYSPDRAEIMHVYFNTDPTEKVLRGLSIENYPFDGDKPSSYSEAANIANSLLEKLDFIPCNPKANIVYADDYDFKLNSEEYTDIFRPLADFGFLPYKKNYKLIYYTIDYNDDNPAYMQIYMSNPCQLESKTEDVPLLAWPEIKIIVEHELKTNIAKYTDFIQDGVIHIGPFINLEQVLILSDDKLRLSLIPAWTFHVIQSNADSGGDDEVEVKTTILTINAIDGSIVKATSLNDYY